MQWHLIILNEHTKSYKIQSSVNYVNMCNITHDASRHHRRIKS